MLNEPSAETEPEPIEISGPNQENNTDVLPAETSLPEEVTPASNVLSIVGPTVSGVVSTKIKAPPPLVYTSYELKFCQACSVMFLRLSGYVDITFCGMPHCRDSNTWAYGGDK